MSRPSLAELDRLQLYDRTHREEIDSIYEESGMLRLFETVEELTELVKKQHHVLPKEQFDDNYRGINKAESSLRKARMIIIRNEGNGVWVELGMNLRDGYRGFSTILYNIGIWGEENIALSAIGEKLRETMERIDRVVNKLGMPSVH